MDSRGNLQASTFVLPQVAPQRQAPQQPYDDGLKALENIQHVNGVTNDYFQKVMDLKSYMHNVQSNLGIDVRVPDMSRPESLKLHEYYRTALADIMAQGNLLQNSRATNMAREARQVKYVTDPTSMAADQMQPGVDFYERAADPTVTEANNLTQQASYDDQSYNQKLQEYNDKRAYYDDLITKDPTKKAQYEYQKSILTPPARAIKQFAPQRDPNSTYSDRRFGKGVESGGNMLKKITNMSVGAHDSYKPDPNNLNAQGHPYLISKEMAGDSYGQDADGKSDAISFWRFDPDTKETTLVLKSGASIPADQDPASITRTIVGSNSKFGFGGEHLDAYIDKNNLRTATGEVNRDMLLDPQYAAKQEMKIKDSQKLAMKTGPAVEALTNKIKNMTSRAIGSNDVVQAGKFEIEKSWGKDAYVIKNLRAVVPPASFKTKDAANKFYSSFEKWPDNNPEALSKWLIKNGAHIEDYVKEHSQASGTESASTSSTSEPQQETAGQKALREYRERTK